MVHRAWNTRAGTLEEDDLLVQHLCIHITQTVFMCSPTAPLVTGCHAGHAGTPTSILRLWFQL